MVTEPKSCEFRGGCSSTKRREVLCWVSRPMGWENLESQKVSPLLKTRGLGCQCTCTLLLKKTGWDVHPQKGSSKTGSLKQKKKRVPHGDPAIVTNGSMKNNDQLYT